MHARIQKIPALALAAALQVLPVARVACVNPGAAPSGFAIICRWFVGAVALLGSYHAVSGASAAIAGLQNLNPVGPLTTNSTGTVGHSFTNRIVVTNPGTTPQQAFYKADPLPPGLTINTNLGGNGYITGTPTTEGVYQVLLTAGNANFATVVTLWVTITITGSGSSPPQITGPPVNQTVQAGANVAFNVTATGTSPLRYSWKFGNIPIVGATNSSLQLANVQTTDSGTYTVTVTNSAGSTNALATLIVNAASTPPGITTPPQSLTVTNGGSAGFSVVASGTAPLSYQWLKDSVILPGATIFSYSISVATTNDAGNYTVVVTNSSGSVTSSIAVLTVLVPPSIVTQPQSLTISNGVDASFSVVASGSAPLSYQWKFNGNKLVGATAASYAITNAQPAQSGDYTVDVGNSVDTVTSSPAHLTVQGPPASAFTMAAPLWTNSTWILQVSGPVQTNYVLWRSDRLTAWAAIKTNFSATGIVQFTDTNSASGNSFYQATLSP